MLLTSLPLKRELTVQGDSQLCQHKAQSCILFWSSHFSLETGSNTDSLNDFYSNRLAFCKWRREVRALKQVNLAA